MPGKKQRYTKKVRKEKHMCCKINLVTISSYIEYSISFTTQWLQKLYFYLVENCLMRVH